VPPVPGTRSPTNEAELMVVPPGGERGVPDAPLGTQRVTREDTITLVAETSQDCAKSARSARSREWWSIGAIKKP
jgi:hypothetical protein